MPEKLPDLVVLSLFRILQEIISNITKYANAKNLSIELVGYEDELSVVIEDDGNGFDLEFFKNSDGNGWNNISYRAELIKAELDIDTKKGQKGSTYSINIPHL